MKIITIAEAKAKGLNRYFTGKPCKRGHLSERKTAGRTCMACYRLRKKAMREANPEQFRKEWRDWAKRNQHVIKQWNEKNPDKRRATALRWHRKYPEQSKANFKRWYKNRTPEQREAKRAACRHYHYEGPQNPHGEKQWLKKNRAQLRSVKRWLKNPQSRPEVSR